MRSPEYLIFDYLLQECNRKIKNFVSHVSVEMNASKINFSNVTNGILSINKIITSTKINRNAVYYLSGPQQMIFSFKEKMLVNGILENNIIFDEWE